MNDLQKMISESGQTAKQILRQFAKEQQESWPLAAAGFEGLGKVGEKQFDFGDFVIKAQFNPERIRSSAAKVDAKSVAERRCFLCMQNLPAEQKAISCGGDFQILVNPFPIFHSHFTIVSAIHTNQLFVPNIGEMLRITRLMEGFTLFYNGPECGASAPDHLHFQAGENGFLPIDRDYESIKNTGELLFSDDSMEIRAFENYLRKMISVQTVSLENGTEIIRFFTEKFHLLQPEKSEPMLNVICSFENGKWIIHLFPRKLHRPSHFFAEGDAQILISPASVDFGGVFILPRKVDFDKITAADIAGIFKQVTVDDTVFGELKTFLKNFLLC